MWYCTDCESYFNDDELVIERENHTELAGMGGVTWEEFGVCPHCGSDDICKATAKCDVCGEVFYKTRAVGDMELCDECYEALAEEMQKAKEHIAEWLGIDEKSAEDLMNYYWE